MQGMGHIRGKEAARYLNLHYSRIDHFTDPHIDSVSTIERTYGWSITSASSTSLIMTYRSTLQLFFHPSSFNTSISSQENAPIGLTYIADTREHRSQPLTTEKRFFLQIIRAQLQCLQQSTTSIPSLLHFITSSWASACAVAEESRLLFTQLITSSSIVSDEQLTIHATILLQAMVTKVEVRFEVNVKSREGVETTKTKIKATARVVYGEALKEIMMGEFVEKRIGQGSSWVEAVCELEEKLRARGKR